MDDKEDLIEEYAGILLTYIDEDREKYEVFKKFYDIPQIIGNEACSNSVYFEDAASLVKNAEEFPMDERWVDEDDIETVAMIYDDLGVLSIEEGTPYEGHYISGFDHHGKGGTDSWDKIIKEVEEAIDEAEELHCWNQYNRLEEEEREELE